MQKSAGLSCAAKPLRLTAQYDKKTRNVTNICDVQVRRFQTCMHLVREYEQDHSVTFEWITRQRPDVYWQKPPGDISLLKKNVVYFREWRWCGYGNGDWFYMVP